MPLGYKNVTSGPKLTLFGFETLRQIKICVELYTSVLWIAWTVYMYNLYPSFPLSPPSPADISSLPWNKPLEVSGTTLHHHSSLNGSTYSIIQD